MSLVLVDELGRGANHEDGVSTAWSIIEKFIEGLNYVAVVTHYHQLTSLESMYPCCKNLHFRAQEIKEENQIVSLNPTFQLEVGPSHLTKGYGILIAKQMQLPEIFIKEAESYQN